MCVIKRFVPGISAWIQSGEGDIWELFHGPAGPRGVIFRILFCSASCREESRLSRMMDVFSFGTPEGKHTQVFWLKLLETGSFHWVNISSFPSSILKIVRKAIGEGGRESHSLTVLSCATVAVICLKYLSSVSQRNWRCFQAELDTFKSQMQVGWGIDWPAIRWRVKIFYKKLSTSSGLCV